MSGTLFSLQRIRREQRLALGSWLLALLCVAYLFQKQWIGLWNSYADHPEHGHALLIPIVVGYLIWQRRSLLAQLRFSGTWLAVPVVAFGVALRHLGVLTSAWTLVQLGLVLVTCGLVVAFIGVRSARAIGIPLAFALFAVPLPDTVLHEISSKLQLWSSKIGVSLIAACNITVHLDGNIIDLGSMKLQVAEACSGLKYLLSLLVLGCILAYFFIAPLWKRILLFISVVPITVFMNSVRIALTGITVEYFGRSAAEGFMHDFEGVVVFLGALVILMAEMLLLSKLGRGSGQSALLRIGSGAPSSWTHSFPKYPPVAFYASIVVVLFGALLPDLIPRPARPHIAERMAFDEFPMKLEGWLGERHVLAKEHLDVLRPDDYLMADYRDETREIVNAHVQYFNSQSKYRSTHSPRVCIPGAGWEIASIETRTLQTVLHGSGRLRVARAKIVKGEMSMLVYYWFQQRGHVTVHEWETKLRLLSDSIFTGRSDGALVRLITPALKGENEFAADSRLEAFARAFVPNLGAYLPE